MAHMAMVVPLDGYRATAKTLTATASSLGSPYASPEAECLLGDAGPDREGADSIISPHGRLDSEFNIGASLTTAQ